MFQISGFSFWEISMNPAIASETNLLRASARRITYALFVSQSLFSAAFIAAFTLSPIIVAELSGSEQAAGLPSTLTLLSRAAVAYPLGWCLDRWGRRLGLSLSYALGVLGGLISFLAVVNGSFWGFLAGATLMGMTRAGGEQSRFIAAEVQPPAQQARAIGLVVFAGTIGSIGGPLLVGPATEWAAAWQMPANAGPFLATTLLLLLGLLITIAFLRPDPLKLGQQMAAAFPLPHLAEQTNRAARPLSQIFSSPSVRLAVLAMAIGQFVMSLLMVITPLHMNHHNHTQQAISWVIMAHTLGMFGLSGITGRLVERFGQLSVIGSGTVILLISSLAAPFSPDLIPLAVALFLLGLGWNFTFIAGSSLLSSQLNTQERGRVQGTSDMIVSLTGGAASLGSGFLFAAGGMGLIGSIGLGLSLALLVWTIWQRLGARRANAPI